MVSSTLRLLCLPSSLNHRAWPIEGDQGIFIKLVAEKIIGQLFGTQNVLFHFTIETYYARS